ncbi:MAG: hypothetical protein O2826_01855 [Chloroflexi bacterium]|nr:hypothetical protein [Chloroflexota bacterium]MDA1173246.1 hypothetical protein [Chloroflexota bacterium]
MVLNGVVTRHLSSFLDAERAIHIEFGIGLTIGQACLRRRHTEALTETGQELPEDTVRAHQRVCACETQLCHQPVLEGPVGPLNPTLSLGTHGEYLGDSQLSEGTPQLSAPAEGTGLLVRREPPGDKGCMPVGVDSQRDPVLLNHAPQQAQITLRGLLFLEHGMGSRPGRIVDREEEAEARPTLLQPGVMAAVELEQHSFLWHPLAPGPVPRRSPEARTWESRARQ